MIKKTSRILWRKRIVEVFLIMATEIIFVFVSHLFQLDGMDSVMMLLKKLGNEVIVRSQHQYASADRLISLTSFLSSSFREAPRGEGKHRRRKPL